MASDLTPTITISSVAGTLTLEHEHSAYPFAGRKLERKFEERKTRHSSTGAAKKIRIWDQYAVTDQSLSLTIPYMTSAQVAILEAMAFADPPLVNVTFRGESWTADLVLSADSENTWRKTCFNAHFDLLRVT